VRWPSAALSPRDPRALIAVDLGAESCRVTLLRWVQGEPQLTLVQRSPNGPVRAADGTLRWPMLSMLESIEVGLGTAAALAPEGIRSIAVDGWAVDYVRLGAENEPLEPPFCYRDERARSAMERLHEKISAERLREITGIEVQPLNTLYQMYADRLSGRDSSRWLNLPEYLLSRWGAEPVAEHTNASHTGMLDLYAGNWSREILRAAGLDLRCAPRVVPPGTVLGKVSGPLALVPGLQDAELIAPACHDTASAIAGIAADGDDWAYISCGTWSLVGALITTPLNGPSVRAENFTNLGALGGQTCFHKSVNGMWMLKQCMDCWRESGVSWSLPELLAASESEPAPASLLRVDDPSLLSMGNMPGRINALRVAEGLPPLCEKGENAPALVSLLMHSLAARYAEVIRQVEQHTGRALRRIVMVGGGAQNKLLRRLTAERTGKEILVGPAESSTIGNFAVQLGVLEGTAPVTSQEFVPIVAQWAGRLGAVALEPLAR
jgi:rhamnulokinase